MEYFCQASLTPFNPARLRTKSKYLYASSGGVDADSFNVSAYNKYKSATRIIGNGILPSPPHVPEPPVEVSINGLCSFFAQYPVKLYDSPDFPAISVLALPA